MSPTFVPNRASDDERPGGLGGDWGGIRPKIEDPMSWSLPMARLGRAELRIHGLFLLFILIQLARAVVAPRDSEAYAPLDLPWTAVWLIFLWWIVLAHELGHTLVNRAMGGAPSEILMWPLGGLARVRTRPGWQPQLITALAGPCVNLVLFIILASVLYLQTGSGSVAFPPPLLDSEDLAPAIVATGGSWFLTGLFIIHWANAIVLLFNLLPFYPFDGANILHALIWRSIGYTRAMRVVARIGIGGSVLLGVLAILFASGVNAAYLIAIAFFCGFISVGSLRRLEFTEEELEELDPDERVQYTDSERDSGVIGRVHGASPQAEKPQVDHILEKIKDKGISSLSLRERWALRRATRRRRKGR